MTRKIIFIITFALLSSSISAQTYFGFKVGFNGSNIGGDNNLKGIKPAMHVGAVAEIQVSDLFSIQPELLYSIQGSQKKNDVSQQNLPPSVQASRGERESYIKNNNHYITLPIMVKYFVSDFISIDAGPQVGYLVFAKTSNGWEEWTDTKDSLNAFDYGVNLGASYEMDNGMNINIRYNYNFANIYKSNNFDFKANNTNIQVSLGYKFY